MRCGRWGVGMAVVAAAVVVSGCGTSTGAGSTTSAAAASSAGSGTSASSSAAAAAPELVGTGTGGLVVYNAQHENLTQAWAEAFTKETGIPGRDAQRQRQRTGQPVGGGGIRFAGGRVPDGELAGDEHRGARRPVRPGGCRDDGAGPGAASTRRPGTGWDRRQVNGIRLQPDLGGGGGPAGVDHGSAGPGVAGQVGGLAERRRLPGDRQRDPANPRVRTRPAPGWTR